MNFETQNGFEEHDDFVAMQNGFEERNECIAMQNGHATIVWF